MKEYEENDIFNCDETGLFYKQTSLKTCICSDENEANGKFSKERNIISKYLTFCDYVIDYITNVH